MFERGWCVTHVPLSARSSRSASSIWTQCAAIVHSPRIRRSLRRLHDPLTAWQAVVLVGFVLRDVDVKAAVVGVSALPQRRVAQRQAGVQAERAPHPCPLLARLDEPQVLRDSRFGFFLSVAVGHFVAQHAAQPRLVHRIGDHIQAALNEIGAGMVIEQRGRAMLDRIDQAHQRAGAHRVPVERLVQRPPQPLEDRREIRWRVAGNRHAPRIRPVKMCVGADVPRHDQLPPRIEPLSLRVAFAQFARRANRP